MSICWHCGETIEFRYVNGRLTPIHVNGGWCQGDSEYSKENSSFREKFEDVCTKTACPECGGSVFFIRHNGGSVWVDSLGWPWPKHPCMYSEKVPKWFDYFREKEPELGEDDNGHFIGVVVEGKRFPTGDVTTSKIVLAIDGGQQGRVLLSTEAHTTAVYLKGSIAIVNLKDMRITFSIFRVNKIFEVGINPNDIGLPTGWSKEKRR